MNILPNQAANAINAITAAVLAHGQIGEDELLTIFSRLELYHGAEPHADELREILDNGGFLFQVTSDAE